MFYNAYYFKMHIYILRNTHLKCAVVCYSTVCFKSLCITHIKYVAIV